MRTELVTLETDTTPIDGAFHWPEKGPVHAGVLLLHGNTMNFYVGPPRFLPPALTASGLACLAFNRRGHDILSLRNSRTAEGGAYQTNAESLQDIRLAENWMAARGLPSPAIVGHSHGGLLGVAHAASHRQTPALVLLSAHRGGRPDPRRPGRILAGDRAQEVMAHAKSLVAAGRGRQLMLLPHWWYAISAQSYVDHMETTPDVLDLAPAVRCPVLYVRGAREEPAIYPAEAFQARAGGPCDVSIVADGDHFYDGVESTVSALVSSWLSGHLVAASVR